MNRIHAKSVTYDCDLLLDTNSEIYPIRLGDSLTVVLASTLSLDGSPDDGTFNQTGEPTLADNYEYVMYGRVFEFDHKGKGKVSIQISFGGLLMRLEGDHKLLSAINPDAKLYILVKKDKK